MAKKKEEPDYITHVSKVKIGGYKSIESVSIEFEKGLNILIGENGTGKWNFFGALCYLIASPGGWNISEIYNIPQFWDVIFITDENEEIQWNKLGHVINEQKLRLGAPGAISLK